MKQTSLFQIPLYRQRLGYRITCITIFSCGL